MEERVGSGAWFGVYGNNNGGEDSSGGWEEGVGGWGGNGVWEEGGGGKTERGRVGKEREQGRTGGRERLLERRGKWKC